MALRYRLCIHCNQRTRSKPCTSQTSHCDLDNWTRERTRWPRLSSPRRTQRWTSSIKTARSCGECVCAGWQTRYRVGEEEGGRESDATAARRFASPPPRCCAGRRRRIRASRRLATLVHHQPAYIHTHRAPHPHSPLHTQHARRVPPPHRRARPRARGGALPPVHLPGVPVGVALPRGAPPQGPRPRHWRQRGAPDVPADAPGRPR